MSLGTRDRVSTVLKRADCLTADWVLGPSLFFLTLHFSSSTTRLNSGILAGSLGNSLLKTSLNSSHKACNLFCKSSSPDIWINESALTSWFSLVTVISSEQSFDLRRLNALVISLVTE